MKIVLIVHGFPKLSETFIVNKFLSLLDKGYDVHIVCKNNTYHSWDTFPNLSSTLKDRVKYQPSTRPRWRAFIVFLWMLARCFQQAPRATWHYLSSGWQDKRWGVLSNFHVDAPMILLQPDVLHFEFGTLAANRMHLRDWLITRVVVSFRGYDLNYVGLDQPGYYNDIWAKAAGIHCLGEDLWLRAQHRGCPPDKMHALISPAIDVDFFRRQRRPDPEYPLQIVSVGRLTWKKGYDYALKAIRILVEEGYSLEYVIIGSGNLIEALGFYRHLWGLENHVKVLGALPQSEILAHLEWATVFLHASVSEGFSNAVMEAQAYELPVVTTDADGLSENIEDGVTGFVVPRRDPEALAEKLMLLADNPRLGEHMGKAGRLRVIKHFTLDRQIEEFVDFYSRILATEE